MIYNRSARNSVLGCSDNTQLQNGTSRLDVNRRPIDVEVVKAGIGNEDRRRSEYNAADKEALSAWK